MAMVAAAAVAAAAATRVEGPVAVQSASLELGEGYGTCELEDAAVVIVTEEGIGRCYYYPYVSEEEANQYFSSTSWRLTCRIMFSWQNGAFINEIRQGGLHRMAMKTIRRTAMRFNVCGKVFTMCNTLGLCSYHFVNAETAYVSFSCEECASWMLDDGCKLPSEKLFENIEYDRSQRRFRGLIDWSPTSFCADQLWEYEMIFDESFTCIVGGQVRHYTPDVSDRESNQQVMHYVHPLSGTDAHELRYSRWHENDGSSSSLGLPTDMHVGDAVECDNQSLHNSQADAPMPKLLGGVT